VKLLPPPGPDRRRQLTRLLVLIVIVGALTWYQFGRSGPADNKPASSNAKATATGSAGPPVLPEPVKLSALAPEGEPPASNRNLFRFGVHPPPPPPPGSSSAAGRAAMLPPPTPTPPPGPPPIDLKFLALMDRPDVGKVATLKDPATGALFQALEGQIVDGRYRLVRIGLESVVVSYVDGSGQRTIKLGG